MLRESLLALMSERGWDEVTVQAICERAAVGRSTFYAHFTDKEELLLSGFDELHAALREIVRSSAPRPLAFVRPLIEHVREGYWSATRRRIRALTTGRNRQVIRERMTQLVIDLLEEEIADAMPTGARRDIAVRYLAGALIELLLSDPASAKRSSSAEIEQVYRTLTLAVLRELPRI